MVVEGVDGEPEDGKEELEPEPKAGEEDLGALSLQAIEGSTMGGTFKIQGILEGQHIIILLDNNSSHSHSWTKE